MKNLLRIARPLLASLIAAAAYTFSPLLHAEQYAVLVGVGDYPVKPLSGPVNDVEAMRDALMQNWQFKAGNIAVLLNQQATKKNILAGLNGLHARSKPGDSVFIYLSGHGTSASDRALGTPLPTTTGAFIPVDIKGLKTRKELMEHLIVGSSDLRPIISKLDNDGRYVFVAIDACYSGNTVRGAYNSDPLPTRALSIDEMLPDRAFGDDVAPMEAKDWQRAESHENNRYPYSHVYYLSAAGEHEPAQDIPEKMLRKFPTFDAKPHGAFTDTLLRVLNKTINADMNFDGQISYAELKQTVRTNMRKRGFNHTPQGLPTVAEDSANLSNNGIFATQRGLGRLPAAVPVVLASAGTPTVLPAPSVAAVAVPISKVAVTSSQAVVAPTLPAVTTPTLSTAKSTLPSIKIRLDPSALTLKEQLQSLASVELVTTNQDLSISTKGEQVNLISPDGDLIFSLPRGQKTLLNQAIVSQAWRNQIVSAPYPQDFALDIELADNGRGDTLVAGDTVGFSIVASQDTHMLLLDVDPAGLVSVIYPFRANEAQAVPGGKPLLLNNIAKVRAPFGRDTVLLYGFDNASAEYQQLVGQQFGADSPLMATLERLLADASLKRARATFDLITGPRT